MLTACVFEKWHELGLQGFAELGLISRHVGDSIANRGNGLEARSLCCSRHLHVGKGVSRLSKTNTSVTGKLSSFNS